MSFPFSTFPMGSRMTTLSYIEVKCSISRESCTLRIRVVTGWFAGVDGSTVASCWKRKRRCLPYLLEGEDKIAETKMLELEGFVVMNAAAEFDVLKEES